MASNAATKPSTSAQRPTPEVLNPGPGAPSMATTAAGAQGEGGGASKKKKRRKKNKVNRRQSFAAPEVPSVAEAARRSREQLEGQNGEGTRPGFYRLGQSGRGNLSDESLSSEALLDHRDYPPMRKRRDSRMGIGNNLSASYHAGYNTNQPREGNARRQWKTHAHSDNEDEGLNTNARTPLLGSIYESPSSKHGQGYGILKNYHQSQGQRESSVEPSTSSMARRPTMGREQSASYDVNNPPSVPGSPKLGPEVGYDDVMVTDPFTPRSPKERRKSLGDQLIDIDGDAPQEQAHDSTPPTPRPNGDRRHTMAIPAEGDVCFPVEGMSEIAEEDYHASPEEYGHQRRRRQKEWPDLSVFEEWSREEKEVRSEGIRTKKISEPVLVGGRLRPIKNAWHRTEEDAPFRYTYFNEEFQSTIHAQTISELVQPGQSFRELFIPDPPELSDYSSDEEDIFSNQGTITEKFDVSPRGEPRSVSGPLSTLDGHTSHHSRERSGESAQAGVHVPPQDSNERPKRYGAKPTFWLDVLSPTDTEMRVLAKAFGIHPLTAEDIMMQEAREKVELFRNYYFVNYRTFEQDINSENYLEPVNMYVVVFRDGVVSFHFSMTPHPANVRRRIRQLKDYLILSSDWISYAIIDDITDVFAPLIQSIEEEVDEIDDAILELHQKTQEGSTKAKEKLSKDDEKHSESSDGAPESGGDMLRRVGGARKKVMSLYRLLGNKADVIKGFAKRCNEQWEIAPRSEIGLYLGDIQDHILTMTSNLSHYETLLSRAHSNYLAQISIRMNERQEQTADVLGKLTVLGTIVLPMNIITGLWGMNTLVPGQEVDNLNWFFSITAGLLIFGICCFFIAKRVYGIV